MKQYISHELNTARTAQTPPLLQFTTQQDLSTWQSSAKEKLLELLGLPLEICHDDFTVTSDTITEEYREIQFEFQSETGYYIPCNLLIPRNAEKALPVAICLQGHATGKHISLGKKKFDRDTDASIASRCFALQAVRNGICAIALDQRYMGEAGQQENGAPICLRNYTALSAML